MEFVKVDAIVRSEKGKGAARKLRKQGLVPAVLYGKGMNSVKLAVSPRGLSAALAGPLKGNTVLSLVMKDPAGAAAGEKTAMVREHQYDPVSRQILHVDFLAVDMDRKVRVEVPLRLVGRAAGEQVGGQVVTLLRTITVECLPAAIPEALVADISHLEINRHLAVKDLVLPAGARTVLDPQTALVSVVMPKREEKPAEAVAAEGEAAAEGAAAEGEAAAEGKGDDKSAKAVAKAEAKAKIAAAEAEAAAAESKGKSKGKGKE